MISANRIIPVNIDLCHRDFKTAAEFYFSAISNDIDFEGDCHRATSIQKSIGCDFGVAIFFERSLSVLNEQTSHAEAAVRAFFCELERYKIAHRIQSISLIDAGCEESAPISDLAVLRRKLEIASEFVPEGTGGHVYTMDFADCLASGTPKNFFDTASREFKSHLVSYLGNTLASLNGPIKDGSKIIPQPITSSKLKDVLSELEDFSQLGANT